MRRRVGASQLQKSSLSVHLWSHGSKEGGGNKKLEKMDACIKKMQVELAHRFRHSLHFGQEIAIYPVLKDSPLSWFTGKHDELNLEVS